VSGNGASPSEEPVPATKAQYQAAAKQAFREQMALYERNRANGAEVEIPVE
jgi:hypothetical protein